MKESDIGKVFLFACPWETIPGGSTMRMPCSFAVT